MTADQVGIFFLVFILSMLIYTQSMQKKGLGDDDDSLSWAIGEYFHFFFCSLYFLIMN